MRIRSSYLTLAPLLALLIAGCGGDKTEQAAKPATPPASDGLTAFQMENGIGPVTEPVTLGPLDQAMAAEGAQAFQTKCSACHKFEERYVGPPLAGITERRTPAYIMNMLMNPDGMYAKHPEARKLLAEYMTQMPNLGITQDEARKILEYLRTQPTSAAGQ